VDLKLEGAQLRLRVTDDGCGFDPAHPAEGRTMAGRIARGNGLANMRRRLTDIGGGCEIGSEPGRGTTVTFTVFLHEDGRGQQVVGKTYDDTKNISGVR
jgi:signal transduction histidine kinase